MRKLSKKGFLTAAGKLTKNGVRSGHSLFTQGKSNSRWFGPFLTPPATLPSLLQTPPPPPPRQKGSSNRESTECPFWAGVQKPQVWAAHKRSACEQNSATSLAEAAARSPEAGAEAGAEAGQQAPPGTVQAEDGTRKKKDKSFKFLPLPT